jgi:hypothetical protein
VKAFRAGDLVKFYRTGELALLLGFKTLGEGDYARKCLEIMWASTGNIEIKSMKLFTVIAKGER